MQLVAGSVTCLILLGIRPLFLPTISSVIGFGYAVLTLPVLLVVAIHVGTAGRVTWKAILPVGLAMLAGAEVAAGYRYYLDTGVSAWSDTETGAVSVFSLLLQFTTFGIALVARQILLRPRREKDSR